MEVHKPSQELYDYIAQWIHPNFFFSVKDAWNRMGFLGVFGDYVLSCIQGDILEIGVGESSIYLTELARKYKRKIYYCDCGGGKITNPLTVRGYLDEERGIFCIEDSDKMFATRNITALAFSFIDGDHTYEQVKKDFYNILPLTVDNGYIIFHDGYPQEESDINENRCGTVYKLRQEIEQDKNLDCLTLVKGCAMGLGFTIIRKKPKNRAFYNE